MTAKDLQKEIDSLANCVLFIYNGKECGIDPFSHHEYDIWYGKDAFTAKSIDEVMNTPFFEGSPLRDIVDKNVSRKSN